MKIKYSPNSKEKLEQIKKYAGINIVKKIMKEIRSLEHNPRKCPKIENILGIPSCYYFMHIEHNYIFYKLDEEYIYVTCIYNEREDFMSKMFGINLRTKESIDYWGE